MSMVYRKLGNSEVKVSAVTFGAWAIGGWMWGGTNEQKAIEAIRKAVELGVTSIDTAAVYGFGLSEQIVAKAIEPFDRDKVQILTKCGLRWDVDDKAPVRWETTFLDGSPCTIKHYAKHDSVIYECEQSLRRLKLDYIDLYQLHRPDPGTDIEETMEAMAKLLEQGKIRAVGLSNCDIELMQRAGKIVPLTTNQPPYSMVLRDIEKDILPYCEEHNISIIAYSPLQRGLLTGKIKPDAKFGPGDHRAGHPLFTGENLRRINAMCDEMRPIADAHNATLAQLVINWTVHRHGITAALVGARNAQQAEDNAQALNFDLSDEELQRINELVEGLVIEA